MLGVGIRLCGGIKMQNRWVSAIIAGILSLPCHSKTIAEMPNGGGGKVVLTDGICSDNKNYLAYSYMNGQPNLFGCWAYDDSGVHIRWTDGDFRTYPYHYWKLNDKPKTNL